MCGILNLTTTNRDGHTQQRKRGMESESMDPPQSDGGGVAIAEVYWQVFLEQLSHHMGN